MKSENQIIVWGIKVANQNQETITVFVAFSYSISERNVLDYFVVVVVVVFFFSSYFLRALQSGNNRNTVFTRV